MVYLRLTCGLWHLSPVLSPVLYISPAVPLGSIQELPAESCSEIKASEGSKVSVDSKHWIYSDENAGQPIQATCQGQCYLLVIFVQNTNL